MSVEFDRFIGPTVRPEELRTPKARSLARLTGDGKLRFVRLLRCSLLGHADLVVIEVDVEVGQMVQHPIQQVETIGICFDLEDRIAPEALAFREDFPLVPHLNMREWSIPRSLCLFEVRYRDIKSRWTPAQFVERIRTWLRLTARGELHADDQPLEPFLSGTAGMIVIPHDFFTFAECGTTLQTLSIGGFFDHRQRLVLFARRGEASDESKGLNVLAASICCLPNEHGLIDRSPVNLQDLHEFAQRAGGDLLGTLRERLLDWKEVTSWALDARLVILLVLPKMRSSSRAVEEADVWAFCTAKTIREIGGAVGRWVVQENIVGALIQVDETKMGKDVELLPLNVVFTLSRAKLASLNGRSGPVEVPIAAIGGGALGSQILMNAARNGFGRWTLIDDDLLLPHNISRHAAILGAGQIGIGWAKADLIAQMANGLIEDAKPAVVPLLADVLESGERASELAEVLRSAEVILDMSASVTVARALALDVAGRGRRVSLFLNPVGNDLVMLAEDRSRRSTLDALEMQYYRGLLRNADLEDHLRLPADRIRYGRSCRDVSSRVAQEMVALHAAIGAGVLRGIADLDEAAIRIWRANVEDFSVTSNFIQPAAVQVVRIGCWTICADDWVLAELAALRQAKLPCETGGILIGAVDLERNIIYVVDTVPSPPDSKEWPLSYIRGCKGLERRVEEIVDLTVDQLHYIGEWHSHPDGYGCEPSNDDFQAFVWLADKMDADGLPALMLIVGDGHRVAPYLGKMVVGQEPLQYIEITRASGRD